MKKPDEMWGIESGLSLAIVLILILLGTLFLVGWTTERRYQNCMRLKHDEVECHLYSHSR